MTFHVPSDDNQQKERYSSGKHVKRSLPLTVSASLQRASLQQDAEPLPDVITEKDANATLNAPLPGQVEQSGHLAPRKRRLLIIGMALVILVGVIGTRAVVISLLSNHMGKSRPQLIAADNPTSVPTAFLSPTDQATIASTAVIPTAPIVVGATVVRHPTTPAQTQPTATPQSITGTLNVAATTASPGTLIPITIAMNAHVQLSASGVSAFSVSNDGTCANAYYADPDGNRYTSANKSTSCPPLFDAQNVSPTLPTGTLLGSINKGAWFRVGSSFSFVAQQNATVALLFNDKYYVDNSGDYAVTYHIQP